MKVVFELEIMLNVLYMKNLRKAETYRNMENFRKLGYLAIKVEKNFWSYLHKENN